MYDPYAAFKKTILPNGLTVYVAEQDKPYVALEAIVHVGNREDPLGKEGLAHFLEHVVSGNIPDYPDYMLNRRFFQDTGGSVDFGGTSYFSTQYSFLLPNDYSTLAVGLQIFGNMLVGSTLERDLEKEREIILKELWNKHASRKNLEFKNRPIREILGEHRLSRSDGLGIPESILKIGYNDLQSLYNEHYVPQNISIVCAGGLKEEKLIDLLGVTKFSSNTKGVRNPCHLVRSETIFHIPRNNLIKVSAKELGIESELLRYRAGWLLPLSISEEAIGTVSGVLYELLFDEIREKLQLTYSINCGWQTYQDFNLFGIKSDISSKAEKEIEGAVQSIIRKLPNMKSRLEEQRDRLIKSKTFHDPSTERICENAADDIAEFGHINTLKKEREALESLTWNEIERMIDWLCNSKYTVTTMVVP